MGSMEGWVWTVLILAVMLMVPAPVYRVLLLTLAFLIVLPLVLLV